MPSPTSAAAASSTSAMPAEPAKPLPVVVLDDHHDAMKADAGPYSIPAAPGLVLDAAGYSFASDAGPAPDAVHVVHGSDEYFRGQWDGRGKFTISASTLSPVRGRDPFGGFVAGETYIIAVGSEAGVSPDGAMRFAPRWTTKVEVTP
jgi:hypothetical protein